MLCFSAFATCVKLRESYVSFRMLIKLPVAPHCIIFSVFFKLFSFLFFYWVLTLYSFLLVFIAILVFIGFVIVFVFLFFQLLFCFLKRKYT